MGMHDVHGYTLESVESKEVHEIAENIFGKSYYISYEDLVL
jgi:hypothetical protein